MRQIKRTFTVAVLLTLCSFSSAFAEKNPSIIPFDSDKWSLSGATKIEEYKGKQALTLASKEASAPAGFGMALLKDSNFLNGIIEYDVAFDKTRTFAGLQFRIEKNKSYEDFYLRAHQSGNPDANQYMPVYNGVASWQLYSGEQYSRPTEYLFNEWMHVKLVISDQLADIYIQDMTKPSFTVNLKRKAKSGAVSFWGLNLGGDVRYANVSITPMDKPEIKGTPKPEAAAKEGVVSSWAVSQSFDGNFLKDRTTLTEKDKGNVKYIAIKTEQSGVANLAKVQGLKKGFDTTFARLIINSEKDQVKKFNFGFSDKVKVYLNNQLLFEGNDTYLTRDYRFLGSIGLYDALYLPLKKGDNELLLAVTENPADATGWGVQGQFESMQGLEIRTK